MVDIFGGVLVGRFLIGSVFVNLWEWAGWGRLRLRGRTVSFGRG